MKFTLAIFISLGVLQVAKAQTGLSLQVLNLINEARVNPSAFLKEHRAELGTAYIAYLEKAKPVSKIVWDPSLAEMAKRQIENKDLSPVYNGKNDMCGYSSGKSSGSISTDALSYVSDLYRNIHNDEYAYIGLYFNKTNTGYCYELGKTCEKKRIEYSYTGKIDSSGVDFKKLNTAASVTWMNAAEKRMVLEINFVRAYPKVYAQIIQKHLSDESKYWNGLSKDVYDAGMELIDELNAMQPLSILQPQQCVYNAAKIHAGDCEKRKIMAHEGSDGSHPWDRILKQCAELKDGNENLAGSTANPRDPVINLLLDDGISSRGHRYNMLDKAWVYVGCCKYAAEMGMTGWVQNFAR